MSCEPCLLRGRFNKNLFCQDQATAYQMYAPSYKAAWRLSKCFSTVTVEGTSFFYNHVYALPWDLASGFGDGLS